MNKCVLVMLNVTEATRESRRFVNQFDSNESCWREVSTRDEHHDDVIDACAPGERRFLMRKTPAMRRYRLISECGCFIVLLLNRFLWIDAFLSKHECRWRTHHHYVRQLNVATAGPDNDIVSQKTRQTRKRSRNRHPPGYWQDLGNVKMELVHFWTNLGVPSKQPPLIPNEALLNHFERNDLRYVIVSYGGRKSLSERLDGARIMPGTWTIAVQQASPELLCLLRNTTLGLSPKLPPLSPQQKKRIDEKQVKQRNTARWDHSPRRKPKGYWNMETVLKEL